VPSYALGDREPAIHPDDVTVGHNVHIEAAPSATPRAGWCRGVPARVREGHEVPERVTAHTVVFHVERGKRYRTELRLLEG